MLTRLLLLTFTFSAVCDFAQAIHPKEYSYKEATRSQVVKRQHGIRRRDPVPSSGTCASGTRDDKNNCCKTAATTVFYDDLVCCTENAYLSGCGVSNGLTEPDDCCDNGGVLYKDSDGYDACCPADSQIQGDSCAPRNADRMKRSTMMLQDYPSDDPLRSITFRHDSNRGILSPHLVADWIVNNFEVEWQGQTYATKQFQQMQANWHNRTAAGLGGTIGKYAGPYLIADKLKKMYESGQTIFELGHDWAIYLDDMPEVFAALVEHENWNGHVRLGASTWDKDTFRNVLSKHPKWNSTVHDRF